MKHLNIFLIFIVLSVGLTLSQAQSFLTNGLVAYYPFAGNAHDASGNGNNGTIYGGVTLTSDRFGNTNGAYSFDGTDGYIDIGQPVGTSPAYFSQSAWIKYSSLPTTQAPNIDPIITQRQQAGDTWATLGVVSSGSDVNTPTLAVDAAYYLNTCLGSSQIQSNTWVFLCGVYANGTYQIYVNGSLQGALSDGHTPNSTDHMYLMHDAEWNLFFGGVLGDVRIYNRALTSSDVAELYAYETNGVQLVQDVSNTSVLNGQNASFNVVASSSLPLSYQWYSSAPSAAGLASAYAQLTGNFVFSSVVTNGGYGYGAAPGVNFVGGGGSGAAGYASVSNGVVTSITMTNAGYGYTSAPNVIIGPPNGFIFGATNSTLVISNANASSAGNYYVLISSSQGSISSSLASLTILYPPSITSEPLDEVVNAYSNAFFSVTAIGTSPLSYQWLFNSTNLPRATSSSLLVTNVTPPNLGTYAMVVTNDYGSVTSSVANLYLYPYLEAPFSGALTYWGQTNTLSVGAWGSGNLLYQWYFNGVAIPSATSSNLVLSSIQFTNAGLYSVVVSSPYGSVTNTPEQVVVNPASVTLGLFAGVILQGTVGYSYTIQATTDLSNTNSWTTLTNITLTAPLEIWDDNSTDVHTSQQKYYRILPTQ